MGYLVKTLPSLYEGVILKLSINNQNRFNNLIKQLEINPYVGDSLQIRIIIEKRFNGRRIFYIIFDDLKAVLIVALGDKKSQQKIIDFIITNLNEYRKLLKKILENDSI